MQPGLRLIPLVLHAGLVWSVATPGSGLDRPDVWITLKAKLALMAAEGVDGTEIRVDTINNEVFLYGIVPSESAKRIATRTVLEVEGVTAVRDMLTVLPIGGHVADREVDDGEIEDRVERLLRHHERDGIDVEVDSVHEGVVTLDGAADTLSRQASLIERVHNLPGVRRVVNHVAAPYEFHEPPHWHDNMSRSEAASRRMHEAEHEGELDTGLLDDVWITIMVKNRLLANGDVPALQINVDTWNGQVTLFGGVDNEAAKRTAEAETLSVDGVLEVRNHIQVIPEAVAEVVAEQDEAIEGHAREALGRQRGLADIEVEVTNGVARLTGEIDGMLAGLSAATLVRSISGVKAVINDVRVERAVNQMSRRTQRSSSSGRAENTNTGRPEAR